MDFFTKTKKLFGERKSPNLIILPFLSAILLLCCIFNFVYLSGIISVACFLILIYSLYNKNTKSFIKYFPIIFFVVLNIAGCFVVEYADVYLTELKQNSRFIGSLPLLVLSQSLFIFVLFQYDKKWGFDKPVETLKNNFSKNASMIIGILALVSLFLEIYLFISVAPNPSFALGLDRFAYKKMGYLSNFDIRLGTIASYMIVSSAMAVRIKGWRIIGILGILVRLIFLFWTGTKFGGFTDIAMLLLFVYCDKIFQLDKEKLRKVIICMVILAVILCTFAVFAFSLISTRQSSEYLLQRLAQQGQLWSFTFERTGSEYHPLEFDSEIYALSKDSEDISSNVGSNNGIYRIMYFTVDDSSVVDAKISGGSRYTEAGFATAYYYFGPLGAVAFSLIFGLLLGFVVNQLIKMLHEKRIIESMILWRFYGISLTAMSMFVFSNFFDEVSIFSYIILMIFYYVHHKYCSSEELLNFFKKK